MRGWLLILIAVFIDALQAAVDFMFTALGMFSGTAGGGALGCWLGTKIAGSTGCYFLGAVGAAAGSLANPALSSVGIPMGIMLGFAVNFCISATLGAGFVALLWMLGYYHPGITFGGAIAELLPGVDCLPGWTAMAALCVLKKRASEKKASGASAVASLFSPTSLLGGVVGGVVATHQTTLRMQERGAVDAPKAIPQARVAADLRHIAPMPIIRNTERPTYAA